MLREIRGRADESGRRGNGRRGGVASRGGEAEFEIERVK